MKNYNSINRIINAPVEIEKIKKAYKWWSKGYFLFAPLEKTAQMRGIELANIQPNDKILEVAVGTGYSFLELIKRVERSNIVHGVDLTPAMVVKTNKRVSKKGYLNFDLKEGDARCLPFPDETFDVLYNSFMLDLIPTAEFPVILKEYQRVLKKDGRLILVNLSKKENTPVFLEKLYNKVYNWNPYLWGGCRPVFMESFVNETGFKNVNREIPKSIHLSEIITAIK